MTIGISKDLVRQPAHVGAPTREHLHVIEPDSISDGVKPNTTSHFTFPTRSAPGAYLSTEQSYMSFELEVNQHSNDKEVLLDRDTNSLIFETEVLSSGATVARDSNWQRTHALLHDLMLDNQNTNKGNALLMGMDEQDRKGQAVAPANASGVTKNTFVMPIPSQFFSQPSMKYVATHKVDNLTMRIVWQKANLALRSYSTTASATAPTYTINKLRFHLCYLEMGAQTQAQIESASPSKVAGVYWESHKDIIPQGVSSHVTRVAVSKSSLKSLVSAFYDGDLVNKSASETLAGDTKRSSHTARNTNGLNEVVHMINSEPVPTLPLRNLQQNSGTNLKIVGAELQRSMGGLFKTNAEVYKRENFLADPTAVDADKRKNGSSTFMFGCSVEQHGAHGMLTGVSTLNASPQIHMEFSPATTVQQEIETYCQYDVSFEYANGQILLSQ